MVTSEIRIDVNNHTAPDIYARIGESNTRRVKFYPGYYDPDGEFVGLSTEEESIRVEFRMVKPDNTFVVVDLPISIVEDPITFRVMLTPEMCQVGGVGYYDIRIGDSEDADEFLYTAHGRFIIDDNMLTDEMIESVAAVNGLIFPDDFLTEADLDDYVKQEDLTDYATKEYVDDAIAEIQTIDVYSETEHIVGKWIDNSTIYEKTIHITTYSGNDTTISVPGLVKLIAVVAGVGIYNNSQYMSLPYFYGSSDYVRIYSRQGEIHFNAGSTYRDDYTESYITIRYTK